MAPGLSSSGTTHSFTGAAYLVGTQVASLQMRLTVVGHTGPWYEAAIAAGYAYAAASLDLAVRDPLSHKPDYKVEDRAFDRDGYPLTIDRTPR